MEVEITDHLGSKAHAVEGRESGNSRNGYYPKTVRTEIGDYFSCASISATRPTIV